MQTKDRWKKHRKYKTPGKKTKTMVKNEKHSKHKCNSCNRVMHGMPHGKTPVEVKKMSKTERRPTAMFAGTLCNKCRAKIIEEAIKIANKIKKIEECNLKQKKFIEIALKKIE